MSLLLLAIAPVLIVIGWVYLKDKFDKEPKWLLFKMFIMGATISVLITVFISFFTNTFVPNKNIESISYQFFKAFILVALVEEFSKYVIVRFYAQPHKEFNEKLDGIIYAVMVSMGFAALENVLYVFNYGFKTGVLRAFTAVPAHASFAILMGYFMGIAKFSNSKTKLNLLGLLLAVVFHGAYDFFLFIDFIPGTFYGAIIALVVAIILSRRAIKAHQSQSRFNV